MTNKLKKIQKFGIVKVQWILDFVLYKCNWVLQHSFTSKAFLWLYHCWSTRQVFSSTTIMIDLIQWTQPSTWSKHWTGKFCLIHFIVDTLPYWTITFSCLCIITCEKSSSETEIMSERFLHNFWTLKKDFFKNDFYKFVSHWEYIIEANRDYFEE